MARTTPTLILAALFAATAARAPPSSPHTVPAGRDARLRSSCFTSTGEA